MIGQQAYVKRDSRLLVAGNKPRWDCRTAKISQGDIVTKSRQLPIRLRVEHRWLLCFDSSKEVLHFSALRFLRIL